MRMASISTLMVLATVELEFEPVPLSLIFTVIVGSCRVVVRLRLNSQTGQNLLELEFFAVVSVELRFTPTPRLRLHSLYAVSETSIGYHLPYNYN